jgi:Flp pilus assembly protein TadG
MAILLFVIDVAWSIFARATLQNAVREGVRFAVTGQVLPGNTCLGTSVQQVVSQYSFGFITASNAANDVSVTYYSPTNLAQVTGTGATDGGNVVQVAITGVSIHSFGPLWRSITPIPLSAVASDVMESPPNGIPPCP